MALLHEKWSCKLVPCKQELVNLHFSHNMRWYLCIISAMMHAICAFSATTNL